MITTANNMKTILIQQLPYNSNIFFLYPCFFETKLTSTTKSLKPKSNKKNFVFFT